MKNQVGHFRVFPVNDGTGQFAPPGQVDKDGNYCPPATPCTPDKYDIIAFVGDEHAMTAFDRRDLHPAFSVAGERFEVGLIDVKRRWHVDEPVPVAR